MNVRSSYRILLADDDKDDCLFFSEALRESGLHASLNTVYDGEQLMRYLYEEGIEMPSVIFLDLNMPRKNGFSCLSEIKACDTLKKVPVIIFSTSYDADIADRLYKEGAHHYICKPPDFSSLKKVISLSLSQLSVEQPPKSKFVISVKNEDVLK